MQPPRLFIRFTSRSETVRCIPQRAGFLNRARDRLPGVAVVRRGVQHLTDLARMVSIYRPLAASSIVGKH